jgi:hypothetical protein
MKGGCGNGASLPEEAQCGGSLGTAALLLTLEDMLRKAPDTGISRHKSPFTSKVNLQSGGRLVYRGL